MVVKELFARLGLELDEASFSKADVAIGAIKKGFLAFGVAAVSAAAVGIAVAAKATGDFADKVDELSQSTGVGARELQEMAYAAGFSGISIEDLANAMGFLAKKGVKDVRGEMLRLADQFSRMPDSGAKTALAMEKFGRAGKALIPMLNGGRAALEAYADEAHALGVVLDEDGIKAGVQFSDELDRLKATLRGLVYIVGGQVMPGLTKFFTKLRQLVLAVRAWKPDMERITFVLKGFAFVLTSAVLVAIAANISAIITAIGWYGALSVAAVVAAVKMAAAWLAAVAPFALATAAVALVLVALEDLYQFLTGGESVIGDVVEAWKKRFGSLGGFFKEVADGIKAVWQDLFDWLPEPVKPVVQFIVDMLLSPFRGFLAAFEKIPGMAQRLAGVRDILGTSATPFFAGGAASPAASAASSVSSKGPVVAAPQFKADIVVNAAPGMSAQEVAGKVAQASDDWWNTKMREALMGVQ